MNRLTGYLGQAVFYALAAVLAGYFATRPVYRQVPADEAQIKLMIKHGGVRVEDCRKLTTQELSKLPTTARRPIDCSRERSPVTVLLSIDGEPIYQAELQPSGLSKDGPSKAYEKFLVPAGRHLVEVRLRDDVRDQDYKYEGRLEADLKPWQSLSVEFDAERGGFLFR